MQRKIINCNNLIGDSLYLLRPLDVYLKTFRDDCAAITVLNQLGGDIVRRFFAGRVPIYSSTDDAQKDFPDATILRMDAGRSMEIAFKYHVANSKPIHISEGFAFMLGVNIGNETKPPVDWIPKFERSSEKIALISPFSASCSRHSGLPPNKTLDDWNWRHIIRYLRRHGYTVQVVAGPKDLLHDVQLPISSYRTALNLDDLFKLLQSAHLLVTVDNGIGHLASACDVPTISFWPTLNIPAEFIAPLWAPRTMYVMMDSPTRVTPAALLYGLKEMLARIPEN